MFSRFKKRNEIERRARLLSAWKRSEISRLSGSMEYFTKCKRYSLAIECMHNMQTVSEMDYETFSANHFSCRSRDYSVGVHPVSWVNSMIEIRY